VKRKLHGDKRDKLKAEATELCQREGWDLKKFGARLGSNGFVAVLKKRRR
jgi:hypothetical protein